jgi:hypothetical protein
MRRFAMTMRTRMGLGLAVVLLAGATVPAQRPTSALTKDAPAGVSQRKPKETFEDLRGAMELMIRDHGSLEVTRHGAIDVRVRVESLDDLERAKPILEKVLQLESSGTRFGWIDRDQEVKAELTEALGKVPDVLTVNHELRMRDMEKKIDRILKALENPKRDGGE